MFLGFLRRRRAARWDREDTAVLTWLAQFGPAHSLDISVGARLGSVRTGECLTRLQSDGRVTSRSVPAMRHEGFRHLYDITRTRWVSGEPNP